MDAETVLNGKRILFVLCGFELGGAERQALLLARHLQGLGANVRVWGHHHHHTGPERVIEQCETAGIPWEEHKFRWPCGKLAFIRDMFGLLRGLYRVRPDLLLAYTTWPNIGCGLASRWAPVGSFVWGQRDRVPLTGRLARRAYRAASAVVCNAAHEVPFLEERLGPAAGPLEVVHNGIAPSEPKRSVAKWRAALDISTTATVFTMLANLRADKDHPALLHAWHRLLSRYDSGSERPHLVLAGAKQECYVALCDLVNELDLADTVHFAGHVEDTAGLLAATDIGVLASPREGLSNAVVEYMQAGLPVVASDVDGNREALGDSAPNPYFRPGDVNALADALATALDGAVQSEAGAANQARAAAMFSVAGMRDSMTRILCDVLADSQSEAAT